MEPGLIALYVVLYVALYVVMYVAFIVWCVFHDAQRNRRSLSQVHLLTHENVVLKSRIEELSEENRALADYVFKDTKGEA